MQAKQAKFWPLGSKCLSEVKATVYLLELRVNQNPQEPEKILLLLKELAKYVRNWRKIA